VRSTNWAPLALGSDAIMPTTSVPGEQVAV
jgi:hypothetical protein